MIDSAPDRDSVIAAIRTALSEEFNEQIDCSENPYGEKGASAKALAIMKRTDRTGIVNKKFYDIK